MAGVHVQRRDVLTCLRTPAILSDPGAVLSRRSKLPPIRPPRTLSKAAESSTFTSLPFDGYAILYQCRADLHFPFFDEADARIWVMAKLRIPPKFKKALAGFVAMSDDAASRITSIFESADPSATPAGIVGQVREGAIDASIQESEDVIEALISLSVFRTAANKSVEDVVAGVVKELASPPDSLDPVAIRHRIGSVLRTPYLTISSKALHLKQEHQQVLIDATVISDARPVFEEEVIKGFMIVHNLKIVFHKNSVLEESFFAMNDEDLVNLKKAIVRAEAKAKAVRDHVKASSLIVFDMDGE